MHSSRKKAASGRPNSRNHEPQTALHGAVVRLDRRTNSCGATSTDGSCLEPDAATGAEQIVEVECLSAECVVTDDEDDVSAADKEPGTTEGEAVGCMTDGSITCQ